MLYSQSYIARRPPELGWSFTLGNSEHWARKHIVSKSLVAPVASDCCRQFDAISSRLRALHF